MVDRSQQQHNPANVALHYQGGVLSCRAGRRRRQRQRRPGVREHTQIVQGKDRKTKVLSTLRRIGRNVLLLMNHMPLQLGNPDAPHFNGFQRTYIICLTFGTRGPELPDGRHRAITQ